MCKFMLLVFITLVHKSRQHPEDSSPGLNRCGDCSSSKIPHTFTSTGHRCHEEDVNALQKNFTQPTNKFPQCMPRMYQMKYPIARFCCFWSPQLGCQILIGEKHYEKFGVTCVACHQYCRAAKSGVQRTNYGNLATILLALLLLALLKMLIPLNKLRYYDEFGLHAEA
ncbi:uncharacterized protein LOC110189923 [Drosophila serrata]|uniref:uncharacterized protein LOC110189923 n=1 Tax=Drosophila serrata TaxID=7274 RepID=UPI000A1D32B3|nr:uncharacterized protein LOC110189923 [Drosophila serrata]